MREIPSWDEYFLSMLDLVRQRSSDAQTQVASILTEENRVVSMGYNGWPAGIDGLPDVRPEKYKWMIHGEINAIANCKFKPKNPVCYVTAIPCNVCVKALWNFGIRKIISSKLEVACLSDDDYEVLGTLIINGLDFSFKTKNGSFKHLKGIDYYGIKWTETDRQFIIDRTKELLEYEGR